MPNHEMVEEFKVEEASRRHHLRRKTEILFGGFWVATRVVMHQRKANAPQLNDRANQLGNANARPRCRPHVHLLQCKEAVAAVNNRHVQLLVISARKEWHRKRREVCWRLHALAREWPPRCNRRKSVHHTLYTLSLHNGESGAPQPRTYLRTEQQGALTLERVVEAVREAGVIRQCFNGGKERLIVI
jgi:hypothetical protein